MKPTCMENNGDNDDVFVESRYGWFGWTPGWLQRMNRPRWLLLCLCINTLLQVRITFSLNSVVSHYFRHLTHLFYMPWGDCVALIYK